MLVMLRKQTNTNPGSFKLVFGDDAATTVLGGHSEMSFCFNYLKSLNEENRFKGDLHKIKTHRVGAIRPYGVAGYHNISRHQAFHFLSIVELLLFYSKNGGHEYYANLSTGQ